MFAHLWLDSHTMCRLVVSVGAYNTKWCFAYEYWVYQLSRIEAARHHFNNNCNNNLHNVFYMWLLRHIWFSVSELSLSSNFLELNTNPHRCSYATEANTQSHLSSIGLASQNRHTFLCFERFSNNSKKSIVCKINGRTLFESFSLHIERAPAKKSKKLSCSFYLAALDCE